MDDVRWAESIHRNLLSYHPVNIHQTSILDSSTSPSRNIHPYIQGEAHKSSGHRQWIILRSGERRGQFARETRTTRKATTTRIPVSRGSYLQSVGGFLCLSTAMEAVMSSSLVTHKSFHPLSSSIWGRDSKRFSHEVKLGGRPHLRSRGAGVATAYLEPEPNPVSQFFKNVQGSLPIVGLLSRLLNDEGGIGNDRIQPVEFAARVQKNCSYKASQAFYEFQERHGPVAKSQYVLLWCWAAAVGAGLLKSDDLIMSAARLRCSNDIHYEIENLELLMDDAKKRREKSKSPAINVPIEARAEKALDAIMKCCVGASHLDEEDVPLLITILTTVFPSADASEIDRMVTSRLAYSDDDEASAEDNNEEDSTEDFVVEDMANSVAQ